MMFSINKNSYIQSNSGIPPYVINLSVLRAWLNLTRYKTGVKVHPEYNRLNSQQPCIPLTNADVTRRPLAFGRLKVSELRRELHSTDEDLMLASLNSFCDILHDPAIAFEALKLGLPDRLADLMLHELSAVRERVCVTLTILAEVGDAPMAIVHNPAIIAGLKLVIDDVDAYVRFKAAMLIERVCLFWAAADVLITLGFIEILIDCVDKDAEEIVAVHFKSLESMFYSERGREIALENKFFETLAKYIKTAPDIVVPGILRSLGNMLVIQEAKLLSIELNLLETLAKLIHHKDAKIYSATAFVLMFATIKMKAKLQSVNYDDVPGRLVELANNWQTEECQIYCIKALTNLCEYPPLRLKIFKTFFKQIEAIQAKDKEVLRYKDVLVDLVSDVSNLEQKIFVENVQLKAGEKKLSNY